MHGIFTYMGVVSGVNVGKYYIKCLGIVIPMTVHFRLESNSLLARWQSGGSRRGSFPGPHGLRFLLSPRGRTRVDFAARKALRKLLRASVGFV